MKSLNERRPFLIFCFLLLIMVFVAIVLATLVGSVGINPLLIFKVIINNITGSSVFKKDWSDSAQTIIWTIRMPRVILAFMVGAGLTLCGIIMQALTKNSLADPYVLGISSGASAGAVAVIIFGWFSFFGIYHIMFGAAAGAVLAIVLTINAASTNNHTNTMQLVLSGIAVSTFFTAVTNTMIYHTESGSDKVKSAMHWMIGSLGGATWINVIYLGVVFIICCTGIILLHTELDVLLLGDDTATTLGVNLRKVKIVVIILCTALTGAIVSISGVIGFVGLIIPHIARMIIGSAHKRLIPAAILLGGLFVILCDTVSRVIVAPEELPIGVVTSFFGAPFFLWLIRTDGRRRS